MAIGLAGAIVLGGTPAPAAAEPVATEAAFVAHINRLRASKRLAPLKVDPRLTASARTWAAKMAAQNDIFHNMQLPKDAPREWIRLGENVGVGDNEPGSVEAIHDAFVASPTHYKNLVGRFSAVGVGVVEANGQIFVAEHFMDTAKPKKAKKAGRSRGGWASRLR